MHVLQFLLLIGGVRRDDVNDDDDGCFVYYDIFETCVRVSRHQGSGPAL
jgi:hypothetical protein